VKKCAKELNRTFSKEEIQMAKKIWRNAQHPGHKWNANQNHVKIPPHSCQNGYHHQYKQQEMLVRMWRKRNLHTLRVRISTTTMQNSMETPQKTKNRTAIWFSNSTLRYIPTIMQVRLQPRHLYTHVYCCVINNS
jgi:hypothetical protein